MDIVEKRLDEIYPYENNPRRNDKAVEAVAESIKQCGYCAPIVVDENMVVLAGHTRLKALKKLGWSKCEIVVKKGLSEDQKRKYRLLDNKTNEIAEWDFKALENELEGLDFEGFDFGLEIGKSDFDLTDEDFISDTEITKSKKKTAVCPECGCTFEI